MQAHRLAAALAVVLVAAAACGDKEGSTSTSAGGEKSAEAPKLNANYSAFKFGKEYGFACTFALLGEAAEATKSHGFAQKHATALDVTAPPVPTKENAMKELTGTASFDAVKAKHGDKAAAAYALGIALTDASLGANLGADIAQPLAAIEKAAKDAGVPDAVWKTKLDALKTKADADAVTALSKDFEAHFKG